VVNKIDIKNGGIYHQDGNNGNNGNNGNMMYHADTI
jgi:hypothetical protein